MHCGIDFKHTLLKSATYPIIMTKQSIHIHYRWIDISVIDYADHYPALQNYFIVIH